MVKSIFITIIIVSILTEKNDALFVQWDLTGLRLQLCNKDTVFFIYLEVFKITRCHSYKYDTALKGLIVTCEKRNCKPNIYTKVE